MRGSDLCEFLKKELSVKNNSELARAIGVTPSAVSSLNNSKEVKTRQLGNFIRKAIDHKVGEDFRNSINPIVEFFPITIYQPRDKRRYPFDHSHHNDLCQSLKDSVGIYSFYNSEGRIIYLGQTKNNLFSEMVQTFNRGFSQYVVYKVNHSNKPFDFSSSNIPKMKKSSGKLYDTAKYFSAYKVKVDLIDPLEAFSIRLIPNNIVNVKMETARGGKKKV